MLHTKPITLAHFGKIGNAKSINENSTDISSVQANVIALTKDDEELVKKFASTWKGVVTCTEVVEYIGLFMELRFYELKVLVYQWRVRNVVMSFVTEKQRNHVRLAERVALQLYDQIKKVTNYDLYKTSFQKDNIEIVLEAAYNNRKVTTTLDEMLRDSSVSIVSSILLIIDIYDNILMKPNEYGFALQGHHLTDWFKKLTFLLQTLNECTKVLNSLVVVMEIDERMTEYIKKGTSLVIKSVLFASRSSQSLNRQHQNSAVVSTVMEATNVVEDTSRNGKCSSKKKRQKRSSKTFKRSKRINNAMYDHDGKENKSQSNKRLFSYEKLWEDFTSDRGNILYDIYSDSFVQVKSVLL